MNFRTLPILAVICFVASTAEIAQSQTETNMNTTPPQPRAHAKAKITVQSSQGQPIDQSAGPALTEVHIIENFTGDIDAQSTVRALQLLRDDKSASLVSMQRVTGKLAGRTGTFVLQGSETVQDGNIKATWSIVPGSATGDLKGLRGEGGFEGAFGKGSDGTLDYWFE
jgi:hypothetical protein